MTEPTEKRLLNAIEAILDSDCGVKALNDAARLWAEITGDHTYDSEFVIFDDDEPAAVPVQSEGGNYVPANTAI